MSTLHVAQFIEAYYPQYYQWTEIPADECIALSKTQGPWGIFSNLYSLPLVVNGITFNSSEQLFQMLKFADAETLQKIHNCKGMNVKYQAKGAEKQGLRRADWGQIIVDAMKFCLQTKYDQSAEFRQALSETAGKIIVEDQSSFSKKKADTWGAKLIDGKYVGSNLLGRLLMELRDNGRLDYHLAADILAPFATLTAQG